MYSEDKPRMLVSSAMEDFQNNYKETMESIKPEINNFLWERLPERSTLCEMEVLASEIYQLIDDHFDEVGNRLKVKEPEKFQCTNCLDDFNATIRGIWGGKDVCPKCFVALLERGKPKPIERQILDRALNHYHRVYSSENDKAIRHALVEVYKAARAFQLSGFPDTDGEPFPPFPED